MNQKFCFKCGKQIQTNAHFCPFCGAEQVVTESEQQTSFDLSVQPTKAFGKTVDSVPNRVNEYRKAMGFQGETKYVYGYFLSNVTAMVLGGLSFLNTKYFMLSMEKDGILLIGLGVTEKFSGKNAFVKYSEIKDFKSKKKLLEYQWTIDTDQGKLKASITKKRIGQPWQNENAKLMTDELQSRFG